MAFNTYSPSKKGFFTARLKADIQNHNSDKSDSLSKDVEPKNTNNQK